MSRFDDFLAAAGKYQRGHPEQRTGQAHFNALWIFDQSAARAVSSQREPDPFYEDARISLLLDCLRDRWRN